MAIKIRENPKIKGINVLHSEHEISQFADDTSVILYGSEESIFHYIKQKPNIFPYVPTCNKTSLIIIN
jgi:hypothetical protein